MKRKNRFNGVDNQPADRLLITNRTMNSWYTQKLICTPSRQAVPFISCPWHEVEYNEAPGCIMGFGHTVQEIV